MGSEVVKEGGTRGDLFGGERKINLADEQHRYM